MNIIEYDIPEKFKFISYSKEELYQFVLKMIDSLSGAYFVLSDKRKEYLPRTYTTRSEEIISVSSNDLTFTHSLEKEIREMGRLMSSLNPIKYNNFNTSIIHMLPFIPKPTEQYSNNFKKNTKALNNIHCELLRMKLHLTEQKEDNEKGFQLKENRLKDTLNYRNFLLQLNEYIDELNENGTFPIGHLNYNTVSIEVKQSIIELHKELHLIYTEMETSKMIVGSTGNILFAIDNVLTNYRLSMSTTTKVAQSLQYSKIDPDMIYKLSQELSRHFEEQEQINNKMLSIIEESNLKQSIKTTE